MKIKGHLFALAAVVLMVACGSKETLLDQTSTFANNTWQRFNPEVYEFEVDNLDDFYSIDFEIVVDSALMRNSQLPFTVNLYSPDGERRMFYAYINLKENGRWKGEHVEQATHKGLRRMTQNIRPFFSFNSKGTYRMEIGQATSQYDLEGVESFRLLIRRAEIDYKGLNE